MLTWANRFTEQGERHRVGVYSPVKAMPPAQGAAVMTLSIRARLAAMSRCPDARARCASGPITLVLATQAGSALAFTASANSCHPGSSSGECVLS